MLEFEGTSGWSGGVLDDPACAAGNAAPSGSSGGELDDPGTGNAAPSGWFGGEIDDPATGTPSAAPPEWIRSAIVAIALILLCVGASTFFNFRSRVLLFLLSAPWNSDIDCW